MSHDFLEDYLACTSTSLVLIRPVHLRSWHINKVHETDAECHVCYERLDSDAVQFRCCGTVFHRQCIYSFTESLIERWEVDADEFCCLHCRYVLDAHPEDILLHLGSSLWEVRRRRSMLVKIDEYLNQLNKLSLDARLAFLELLHAGVRRRGQITMLQYSMLENRALSTCRTAEERAVLEDMLQLHYDFCEHLLDFWLQWLCFPADIRHYEDWNAVPTRYGNGPKRFEPLLTARMLAIQPPDSVRSEADGARERAEERTELGVIQNSCEPAPVHSHMTTLVHNTTVNAALMPSIVTRHFDSTGVISQSRRTPFAHLNPQVQQIIFLLTQSNRRHLTQVEGMIFPQMFA